jgi:hypothetical protein
MRVYQIKAITHYLTGATNDLSKSETNESTFIRWIYKVDHPLVSSYVQNYYMQRLHVELGI